MSEQLTHEHPLVEAIQVAQSVGRFVLDRLQGGAWAELAEVVTKEQ